MNIQFKKLTPQMTDDFLHYFENDAFPENDSRSSCFCLESHLLNENDYVDVEERREKARELILEGIMTGYLIYDDDRIIGWCNTGDKTNYRPICENDEFRTEDVESGKIKCCIVLILHQIIREKGLQIM